MNLLKGWLLENGVDRVISEGRHLQAQEVDKPGVVEELLAFFERHCQRMAYGTYRTNKWFNGSGVVEAGCRTVVEKRLKQSGMFFCPGPLSQRGPLIPLLLPSHGLFPAALMRFRRPAFPSCCPSQGLGGRNAEVEKLDPWKTYLASL
jgi:hypothetical protein